ncbi:MAG: alpha/beta hydrolase-fold protein [Bacteroidia bacterium]|nr:alpha/beta hydrolase-fold protein [Bacteroidia bacterium]
MKNFGYLFFAIVFFGCKSQAVLYNDPIPDHESWKINSTFVNEERVINVWTPSTYKGGSDSLPVIYMPDGGVKEDFPHIANTLDTLLKQKKIPEFILVGIENTDRRIDLTGPSKVEFDLKYIPNPGGSEKFRGFIKSELFPLIDEKYRTTKSRTLIGESLAGLFVVETFMLDPQMFDHYIAMDPSLWFNEQYLIKNFEELIKDNNYENTTLWFAGSNTIDIQQYTRELEQKLSKSATGLLWQYSDEPREKHNTIFRATKEKALIWTLNNRR